MVLVRGVRVTAFVSLRVTASMNLAMVGDEEDGGLAHSDGVVQ